MAVLKYSHVKKNKVLILLLSISLLWITGSISAPQLYADDAHTSRKGVIENNSDQKIISLKVTATAYTSNASETDSTPNLTAWGDTLKPGMKAIAVSRDLIKIGLTHKTRVTIEGFKGEYIVLDKMHRRWTKKIDIYMGVDQKKALKWGKRKVIIRWQH